MKYTEIVECIRSVYGGMKEVPLHAPIFMGREKEYLADCIDTTFVSSVGMYVDMFEEHLAKITGAKRAVVCVNGTMALFMALKLCGVERGFEVITQPLTFVATANAIAYCGATPVFVDVDGDTMGLSPSAMRKWLENNAEVKGGACFDKNTGSRIAAAVPMHTFGHPAKIDEISSVCDEWHLILVEDAAESVGSLFHGKHTGTFGRIGAMSFNGNKTVTCGGGGAMLFNDAELGARAKYLTTQAKTPHRWEFKHEEMGYNLRMPNINAALGCAQLEQLDNIIENKRQTAAAYREFFAGQPSKDVRFFDEPEGCRSNFWLNTIMFCSRKERDIFLEESNDAGIQTRPAWELMNRLPMYRTCEKGDLSEAELIADRAVNIPSGYRTVCSCRTA